MKAKTKNTTAYDANQLTYIFFIIREGLTVKDALFLSDQYVASFQDKICRWAASRMYHVHSDKIQKIVCYLQLHPIFKTEQHIPYHVVELSAHSVLQIL